MSNLARALRDEMTRLARREIRAQISSQKKIQTQQRKTIAALKREIADLNKKLATIQNQAADPAIPVLGPAPSLIRFSAKGVRSHRKKLGLSADDYGLLLGVSGQAVYNWEDGTSRPRRAMLLKLTALRELGRRDADARVLQHKAAAKKKSK